MMKLRPLMTLAALMTLTTARASEAGAQIRASEPATVSQTIDGATFTIDYSRPRIRGRKDIFGKQVTWEEVWTPGANRATTLRASRDFTINGHAMPKGTYSVWMQVKEKGDWVFMLHGDTMRQHFMHPRVESGKLSFNVTPQITAPNATAPNSATEVLTWSFPAISTTGATLEMAWANVRVPLTLTVAPSLRQTISESDAAPYVGEYEIEWLWNPNRPVKEAMTLHYNAADSTLRADSRMSGQPSTMILARVSPNVFSPIFIMEGDMPESAETMMIEFTGSPKAVTFEVRDKTTDKVQGRGKRKP